MPEKKSEKERPVGGEAKGQIKNQRPNKENISRRRRKTL